MVDTEELPQRPDPHDDGKQDVEPGPDYDPEAEAKALNKKTKPELIEMILELRQAFDAQLAELRETVSTDRPAVEATAEAILRGDHDTDLDGIEMELERIADALERQNDLTQAALTLQEQRAGFTGFQDVRLREAAHDVIRGTG